MSLKRNGMSLFSYFKLRNIFPQDIAAQEEAALKRHLDTDKDKFKEVLICEAFFFLANLPHF